MNSLIFFVSLLCSSSIAGIYQLSIQLIYIIFILLCYGCCTKHQQTTQHKVTANLISCVRQDRLDAATKLTEQRVDTKTATIGWSTVDEANKYYVLDADVKRLIFSAFQFHSNAKITRG